jgi:hypothetical protein
MSQNNDANPRLVLILFVAQVFINWLYISWIKAQPDIINNSWFVVLPLLGYFYLTFAFIASVWLYNKKQSGLILAYCVLMFGTTADVISYNVVFQKQWLIEQLIIPLITINLCVIFYMAYHQIYFKGD